MKPLSVYRRERLVDKIMIIGTDLILKHQVSAFILTYVHLSTLYIFNALFSPIMSVATLDKCRDERSRVLIGMEIKQWRVGVRRLLIMKSNTLHCTCLYLNFIS